MNQKTFTEQFEKYRRRLVCRLYSMTRNWEVAEDIAAQAFTIAFEKRSSFRGGSSFYTWLHAIAVHEFLDHKRKQRFRDHDSLDRPEAQEVGEPDLLSQVMDRQECCAKVKRSLRRIPGIYRRVLVEHFVRQRPTQAIADQERIPVGTVLSRIFRAKRLLQQAWRYAQ